MNQIIEAGLMLRETIMIVPLIVFCFIPVYANKKSTLKQLVVKIIGTLIIIETVMFLIYLMLPSEPATFINMLLAVCCFFQFYQKEVNLEQSHLWFVFITACLLGAFSYLFYHVVDVFIHPVARIESYASLDVLLIQQLFEWVVIAILFYPTKKYLGWMIREFHEEQIWKIVWILPAAFTLLSRFLVPYDNEKAYIGRFLEIYIAVLIIFLILAIFMYVMFYHIAHGMVKNKNMAERTKFLELQGKQYAYLQSHIQETHRIRHDFRHQLIVITELLKNKRYVDLEIYINEYVSSISTVAKQYCANLGINAVLCHYEELCKLEKIIPHFSIRIGDNISIKDIDFCVILGNLLENAVAGCENVPQTHKEITLKIGQTSPHIIAIQISNPYYRIVENQQGKLLSTKHHGEGQGLKSVEMIVEKYDGFMEVDKKNQIFKVKILLNF